MGLASSAGRRALLIDELGRSRGEVDPGSVTYDSSQYDLVMVSKGGEGLDVYKLQPKGLAYRKAKQAHAAAVGARRMSKLKQVIFSTGMAENDYSVHTERVRGFLAKGFKVRVTVNSTPPGKKAGPAQEPPKPDAVCRRIGEALKAVSEMEAAPAVASGGSTLSFQFQLRPRPR